MSPEIKHSAVFMTREHEFGEQGIFKLFYRLLDAGVNVFPPAVLRYRDTPQRFDPRGTWRDQERYASVYLETRSGAGVYCEICGTTYDQTDPDSGCHCGCCNWHADQRDRERVAA
jgi:hypothetical protein